MTITLMIVAFACGWMGSYYLNKWQCEALEDLIRELRKGR